MYKWAGDRGVSARECVARYDYERNMLTPESRDGGCPAAKVLVAVLQSAYPECDAAFFRRRHGQMWRLGERLIPAAAPGPVISPAKVGRNDLCPCGSGKKSKKCCGR